MVGIWLSLFGTFFKIGLFSFGGGYAMIPLISREVAQRHAWLTMGEFIDLIAISQGTPGPIAINSATFIGYKMGGFMGSVMATLGVVAPSFLVMSALTFAFLKWRNLEVVKSMFSGIRPVVVALIFAAAVSVFSESVTGVLPGVVALTVMILVAFLNVDPILLLALAGLMGAVIYR